MANRFCRVSKLTDVLSEPALTSTRETQAVPGDVVRVLREQSSWAEIEKLDGTRGWIIATDLDFDPAANFVSPSVQMTRDEFFSQFAGTPYLSGGLSRAGVDCSGLVQLYFTNVCGRIVPRNSRAQRALITPHSVFENGDLVFAMEHSPESRHHAGLFFDGAIWHADARLGVIRQSIADFTRDYTIEVVGALN